MADKDTQKPAEPIIELVYKPNRAAQVRAVLLVLGVPKEKLPNVEG